MLAVAQSYSKSPMVIVGDEALAPVAAPTVTNATSNFPEQALSRVGENSNPDNAVNAASATNPESQKPSAPATAALISKLWPRDTLQIFMPRCTALKVPFIIPCQCVITKLMGAMGHDEFLKKSEDGTIEQDPRLMQIRTECATTPQRRD